MDPPRPRVIMTQADLCHVYAQLNYLESPFRVGLYSTVHPVTEQSRQEFSETMTLLLGIQGRDRLVR